FIVAEHASARFGGEASLPLYYFKQYRQRGVEAWMVVHARTQDELREILGEDFARVYFVPDTRLHRWLWRLGGMLPAKMAEQTLGVLRQIHTQMLQRNVAKQLVPELKINVIH